ncbi:AtpZ/AtpI family protein [Winogradskyella wichelsiae]|uniref:AtpZ/AtpI family protein n=1 Tax=Winogradskyella wichelsiae TaxID=2697007 RepID=UPI00293BFE2F|nr:AtpZ/AtpI family protein [Winogradskyella wichelsiae]
MSKANNNPSKFIRFTAVGIQMGGVIFLGHYLGQWLDAKYEKDFWDTILTLLSVFASIYLVISQVIKVSKEDD